MNTTSAPPPTPTYDEVLARLRAVGQEHVLAFYDELPETYRHSLLNQAASLDLENLPSLIDQYVLKKPVFELPRDIQPAPYYAAEKGEAGIENPGEVARAAKLRGEELLNMGRIAAFVVAGGQGSRLGFDGPKGCYPAGAVTKKSLFQMFADQLLAAEERYGVPIPWYIMTSPLNHIATLHFFEQEQYFGLKKSNVMFFPQGTLPSLEIKTGKMLMTSKHEIATNPDGHGGSLRALWQSGALDDMKRRNIQHISYFQVDNPIVKIIDPIFIGLHADTHGSWEGQAPSSGEMSSKMIPKAYPEEKLGIFCAVPFDGGIIGQP
ncbi:MAG: UTP--glucose-1-phosphate uridylyltransferase, partial [Pyrinomonadaceae bacterium]|nr:UTP--glucose-1-phosphate uridylyltransferase [Phycisphaerales bacterium]